MLIIAVLLVELAKVKLLQNIDLTEKIGTL